MANSEQKKARRWRARQRVRVKEVRRRQYLSRKTKALNLLGGPVCVECGCDELVFLEINHINGGGSAEWRARNMENSLHESLLTGRRTTEGLNVLCRVCNALDFLARKNPIAANRFKISWAKYTGKDPVREDGVAWSQLKSS